MAERVVKKGSWKAKSEAVGYSSFSKITSPIFNKTLALFFILLGLPVFLIIALIIKLKNGGPIFYRGVRLGINKTPFVMYKF